MTLNKAFLIGRLVRDPDVRITPTGIHIARFTIAIDRYKKKETGESVTDFIRIVCWRRLAEICGQFLKKGKLVAVEGRLQVDSFEKDGQKRESYEIVADTMQMLDKSTDLESSDSFVLAESQNF
jgi:single-strand DNA-binding protein